MGIDHRRFHIFVTEKLLDRPDVIPIFEQMGGKRAGLHGGGPEVSALRWPQAHGLGIVQLG